MANISKFIKDRLLVYGDLSTTWNTVITQGAADAKGFKYVAKDSKVWTANGRMVINKNNEVASTGQVVASYGPYTEAMPLKGIKLYSADNTSATAKELSAFSGEKWSSFVYRQSGSYIVTPTNKYIKHNTSTGKIYVTDSASSTVATGYVLAGSASGSEVTPTSTFSSSVTAYYEKQYEKFTIDGSSVGMTTLSNQIIPATNTWASYIGTGKAFGSDYTLKIADGYVVIYKNSSNLAIRAIKYNGATVKGTDAIVKDTTYIVNQGAFQISDSIYIIDYTGTGTETTTTFATWMSGGTRRYPNTSSGGALKWVGSSLYTSNDAPVLKPVALTNVLKGTYITIGDRYGIGEATIEVALMYWEPGNEDPTATDTFIVPKDTTWATIIANAGGELPSSGGEFTLKVDSTYLRGYYVNGTPAYEGDVYDNSIPGSASDKIVKTRTPAQNAAMAMSFGEYSE